MFDGPRTMAGRLVGMGENRYISGTGGDLLGEFRGCTPWVFDGRDRVDATPFADSGRATP